MTARAESTGKSSAGVAEPGETARENVIGYLFDGDGRQVCAGNLRDPSDHVRPAPDAPDFRALRKTLLRDRICVLAESIRRDAAVVRRIDALRRAGCALHPVLAEMRALSLEAALADLPRVRRLVRRYRAMEAA